ncbi:MAG: peptidase [Novosphingobium lindaniclasticum]|uniref:M28 family peptidase n=1 Tax=Novosphingobium lindaniclasticum TaxID=1329895 RepID=UPI0024096CA0|nr:M28 family peptidase [Novosphingobium lindaniclasticum]MDF2639634.1 peptidase [Novosphingobium lindaniclasticum]
MKSTRLLIVSLMLGLALAVLGTTPPRPASADAPQDEFSAERAMVDVERIARAPHPSGSAEHAALRGYLMQRLSELGLTVRIQQGAFPPDARSELNRRNGKSEEHVPLTNVLGLLRGTESNLPAAALMAHYDSVPGSPAAGDDGAGVASILETLRALSLDRERKRDVLVILTDGEESGLLGARMFFAQAQEARRIGAIINLETRGGGGKANLFQTSALNGDVARLWASTAPHPAGTSLATFIYSILPNDTDLTVALPHGYPAWNFAFIGRPGLYHSPLATAANLDRGSLQQMGEQTLGLARALTRITDLPRRAPDIVFFDAFGLFAIHYAPGWGWAMLAVAFLGYGALVMRQPDLPEMFVGSARMLALLALTGGLLWAFNMVSGADGPVNYYDRLAAIPRLQAIALCATAAVSVLLLGSRPESVAGEVGLVLPVWLAAAAFQASAPTAAYVLTVPLLLSGVVALMRATRAGSGLGVVAVAVAGLVTGYALLLGYSLMQAVGTGLPMVCILPLMMVMPVLVPLRAPLSQGLMKGLSMALLVLAVGVALWVRWDAPAASIAAYEQVPAPGG